MRVGTFTPTLGKRPEFLEQSKRLIFRQTYAPIMRIVDSHDQQKFPHDLTDRYRGGWDYLKDLCELIFFIEDDDYYPADYIETMVEEWKMAGEPDIFGIGETYFCHPRLGYVWYRKHKVGESPAAFQMCVKASAFHKVDWSKIGDLFTDAGLWKQLDGRICRFAKPLSIGIKHGIGICGAGGHNKNLYTDTMKKHGSDQTSNEWAIYDPNWLRNQIGDDAEFYENLRDK